MRLLPVARERTTVQSIFLPTPMVWDLALRTTMIYVGMVIGLNYLVATLGLRLIRFGRVL